MKTQTTSTASNRILRFFFLHTFFPISKILISDNPQHYFPSPQCPLFQQIEPKHVKGENKLFKNLLFTHRRTIIKGGIISAIFVLLNLVLPKLIEMFIGLFHGHLEEHYQIEQAKMFIPIIVVIQLLRIIFYEHSHRIFHELAVTIESALARKLVEKSLYVSKDVRRDIPVSKIYQLENVDLKLVYAMLNNATMLFEAPLTIVIALILLFAENKLYGFIGFYWFLIVFLLHRQLDQKMIHCNKTKLNLIDLRSRENYQLMVMMKEAKLIGWHDLMIDRNNDFLEQENYDHTLFYFYSTLYDVLLLVLPILVTVTICIVDLSEINHITVESMFFMLALLKICYEPMRSIRTISIGLHDALYSLDRIERYLNMAEQNMRKETNTDTTPENQQIRVLMENQASAMYDNYTIKIKNKIEVHPGERLIILAKKQDKTKILKIINGFVDRVWGARIKITGKIAALTQKQFFFKGSVKQNITFYNKSVSQSQIEQISTELGILSQLQSLYGLSTSMNDLSLFSRSLLQRISIARVLCSQSQIYTLDQPFENLSKEETIIVERILRNRQGKAGVLVVMGMRELPDGVSDEDIVGVIGNGNLQLCGRYRQVMDNRQLSLILPYIKTTKLTNNKQLPNQLQNKLGNEKKNISLQTKTNYIIKKTMIKQLSIDTLYQRENSNPQLNLMRRNQLHSIYSNLLTKYFSSNNNKNKTKPNKMHYLKYLIKGVPLRQIILIMGIIFCAELLHVFLHFFIGHLDGQHGHMKYIEFMGMIVVEIVLTVGLAGIIYYEGEVSSMIAVMQGNYMYRNSLFALINKKISYFTAEYPIKTADRFNHDYEEIFIGCHKMLTIYKNIIMLVVTMILMCNYGFSILLFFGFIVVCYSVVYIIFRKVINKITEHYYNYKYSYVKCLEQSVLGSQYITIYDKKKQLLKRTEYKYRHLAQYKSAQIITKQTLSIVSELLNNILLASIIYYNLQMKILNTNINLVFVTFSIHLLMNGSLILKNILMEMINFEIFFNINLLPFLQVNEGEEQICRGKKMYQKLNGYQVRFSNTVLADSSSRKEHTLNLTIKEGEQVFIYEHNHLYRNFLLYALTNNLTLSTNHPSFSNQILIGGTPIQNIDPQQLHKTIGIITTNNYHIAGTLRSNLFRHTPINQPHIMKLIKYLKLDTHLNNFNELGLESVIGGNGDDDGLKEEIIKKLALLRVLAQQAKIVVIKDTVGYIGDISVVGAIREYLPNATIIIINDDIRQLATSNRFIHIENNMIIQEETTPQQLANEIISPIIRQNTNINEHYQIQKNKGRKMRMEENKKQKKKQKYE